MDGAYEVRLTPSERDAILDLLRVHLPAEASPEDVLFVLTRSPEHAPTIERLITHVRTKES